MLSQPLLGEGAEGGGKAGCQADEKNGRLVHRVDKGVRGCGDCAVEKREWLGTWRAATRIRTRAVGLWRPHRQLEERCTSLLRTL